MFRESKILEMKEKLKILKISDLEIDQPADLNKISKELRFLVDEIPIVYAGIFGSKLGGVYASGSWVRGELSKGSDVDFFATLKSTPTLEELKKLEKGEGDAKIRYCPKYIIDIELKYLSLSSRDPLDKLRKVIVFSDACLISGDDLITRSSLNLIDAKTIVSKLTDLYDVRLAALGGNPSTQNSFRDRRMFAKFVFRWLHLLTLTEGGKVSASTSQAISDIATFTPEVLGEARFSLSLYKGSGISDTELRELIRIYDKTSECLRKLGIPARRLDLIKNFRLATNN